MNFLYRILSYLLLILALPVIPFIPRIRDGLPARLGLRRKEIRSARAIWMHGASAGDLSALLPMAEAIRDLRPGQSLFVSTITNSGIAMGRTKFSEIAEIGYAPFDVPFAVRRMVSTVEPVAIVLEYTEIWPNLIAIAKEAGAKVVLVNGRFSRSRIFWYKVFFGAVGNPLDNIDLLLMRDEYEAERALSLGADPLKVRVTGNTKFDALIKTAISPEPRGLAEAVGAGHGRLITFGSIHEGEETPVLDTFCRLRAKFPDVRALIAPRYIERARSILNDARGRGLSASLRSTGPGTADVVVLDTIGELAHAYRYGDIAFVGGSMTGRGGQNILEPAVHGKVVLFGPHMENFRDCVSLLVGRGGIMTRNPTQLLSVVSELLPRVPKLRELGEMARKAVLGTSGATRKNVELILGLLPQ
jgi:3-deoxy-D-manno-octulosonic-acid transferase